MLEFRSFKVLITSKLSNAIVEFPLKERQNFKAALKEGSNNHLKQLGRKTKF